MVADSPTMSCAQLGRELGRRLSGLEGGEGAWCAPLGEFELFAFADEGADRVRLMIPVARAEPDDRELLIVLLTANFDRALDARYAVYDGVVWCLFTDRLAELTPAGLDRAIEAVRTLASNTGSSFASGEARFHGTMGIEGGVS